MSTVSNIRTARDFAAWLGLTPRPNSSGGKARLGRISKAGKAIRENESRVTSLGYNVAAMKVGAFTLSAAVAGLAGATKAVVFQTATLTDVHWTMSGEVVLMTLLGGMGTVLGPIVGAGIIVTLQDYLAGMGAWVTVIIGATFVVCVLTFRRGVVGEIARLLRIQA